MNFKVFLFPFHLLILLHFQKLIFPITTSAPQYLNGYSILVPLRESNFLDCEFSGSIPKIPQGNLCNLRSLDIAYTYISGEINELVESLSACNNSTLETLDLASNQLSGSLPDSLGNLIYLEYLGLSENSLLGTLPPSIGNQSHLGALYLSFNMLTGIIPENNGQLSELYVLELYGNSWEGVITENHFQNLTALNYLTFII